MKNVMFVLMAGCMCLSLPAEAQLMKKLTKKAEQAAERSVLNKTDQKVSKETNKIIDEVLNEDGTTNDANEPSPNQTNSSGEIVTTNSSPSSKTWSKYNFVPGDEIIFEDDLSKEENGEFPSRWDLVKGNAENSSLNGEKIIILGKSSIITPLIEKEDYLPEIFTVEFDAYFNDSYSYWQDYQIRFYPGESSQSKIREDYILFPLKVNKNGAIIQARVQGELKEFTNQGPQNPDGFAGWKHIAISYNQRALKVFIDEDRILNIPNIELSPSLISIEASNSQEEHIRAVKNIRIAEGGKKLYDRIVADGKFVTRGILFDVNQSSIKPESMGVINEIATLLKEHSDLNLSIEGHTDSDGDDAHNLLLSEQRAIAVKEALAGLGIDSSRLQSKGMGETLPVSDNNSPEGKANNRRVEFVKI